MTAPVLCRRDSRMTDCSGCSLQAASCNGRRRRSTGTDFGGGQRKWRAADFGPSRLPYRRAFVRLCLLCCHSIFYVYIHVRVCVLRVVYYYYFSAALSTAAAALPVHEFLNVHQTSALFSRVSCTQPVTPIVFPVQPSSFLPHSAKAFCVHTTFFF